MKQETGYRYRKRPHSCNRKQDTGRGNDLISETGNMIQVEEMTSYLKQDIRYRQGNDLISETGNRIKGEEMTSYLKQETGYR